MRDIKFRAWDVEDELMYHSDKEESDGEGIIVWAVSSEDVYFERVGLFDTNPGCNGHVQEYNYFKPTQKLMQYTGLKDKNGKEIYEGDIVKINYGRWAYEKVGITRYGKVVFEHKTAAFKASIKDSVVLVGFYDINMSEVIGNIYENPELLETK